ncbi:hypothetical protein [Streptomyces triticisoli]|uniref:hypothetical protein n=1 Tax=Streptomyces triticisoli TaxID=2182797 RepID=UPI000DD76879|nr:hypothetical protein [Streptomyces triticisoli]
MRRTTARALPVVVLTGLMAGAAASAASAHPAAQLHRPYARQPGVGAALPADCDSGGTDVCPAASGPVEGAFLGGAPGAPTPEFALPGTPQDPLLRDAPANDPFRDPPPSPQAPYHDPFQDQTSRTPSRPASSHDPSQGQAPRDPFPSRTPSGGQASSDPSRDDGSRDPGRDVGVGRDPSRDDGSRDPGRDVGVGRDPSRDDGSRDPGRDVGVGRDPSRDDGSRDPGRDAATGRDPSRDGAPRDPSRDGTPRDPGQSCATPADRSCVGGVAQHGVQAGAGGAFTTSLPALVVGGLLIAAALGAAVHRVWWRRKD